VGVSLAAGVGVVVFNETLVLGVFDGTLVLVASTELVEVGVGLAMTGLFPSSGFGVFVGPVVAVGGWGGAVGGIVVGAGGRGVAVGVGVFN